MNRPTALVPVGDGMTTSQKFLLSSADASDRIEQDRRATERPNQAMNEPILFDDPLDVMIEEARLLELYRARISEVADNIVKKFSDPLHSRAAAASFIARIGSNIVDHSIATVVKNLAVIEFARRGVT